MDRQARQRESAGRDASPLRNHLVRRAGLTDAQAQAVTQIAEQFEASDREARAREKKLVDDFRSAARAHRAMGAALPPSPLPELKEIQAERDSRAMDERSQLHSMLGDDAFESVEIYIHSNVGRAKRIKLPLPLGQIGGPQ